MSTNLWFNKMKSDLYQLKVNQKFLILWREVFISCLPKKVSFVFKAELLLTRNLDLSAGVELWKNAYSLPWGERLLKEEARCPRA